MPITLLPPSRSPRAAAVLAGLALCGGLALLAPGPAAAAPAASLAEARRQARDLLVDLRHGRISREEARALGGEAPLAFPATPATKADGASLVGTWLVHVPGAAPFDALQTFEGGGTFVETSSLLGALAEGPAHGTWRPLGGSKALLTFELFAFDDGEPAGRIRVRCLLDVKRDSFRAVSAVDVILPDGEVIPEVATGPFRGARVEVLAP